MFTEQPLGLVGNLNVDLIMGPIPHLPHWEQEVLAENMEVRFAGTIGYMAMAAKALGITSIAISAIGNDSFGRFLLEELNKNNLPTDGVVVLDGQPTPLTVVHVGPNGIRAMSSVLGAHKNLDISHYRAKSHLLSNCAEIFVCGSYILPKLDCKAALVIAEDAHRRGQQVYFDPSWDPTNWSTPVRNDTLNLLPLVDVFLLNEEEITTFMRNADWQLAAEQAATFGAQEIVVKRGSRGAAVLISGSWYEVAGYPVEARDTTGAGDVFDISYLWARRQGWEPMNRLKFANAVASLIVAKANRKEYPSIEEMMNLFHQNIDSVIG